MSLSDGLKDGLESLEATIYLVLTTVLLSLVGAAFLHPTGIFPLDMLLTALLWVGAMLGALRGLRHLRRRRLGDLPPREPIARRDVMMDLLSLIFGPLMLCVFLPELLGLEAGSVSFGWALGLSVLGAACVLKPLWSAYKYVMEP